MNEGKLKTAILGLNEGGRLLLEAASRVEHFHIHAVADKDTSLAERLAGEHQCAAFDDYRQLIVEMDSRLSAGEDRCLLVAAATHSCDEYIRMAMKKSFNLLKLAPAGRNFEEAAGFVRLSEDEGVRFAVANTSRFARSFVALHRFLQDGRLEEALGASGTAEDVLEPYLITAFCSLGEHSQPGWRGDPNLAGGGVLLHDCYWLIDQMTWSFQMPQQVYALNTSQAQDKQQRLYLTEDTAVVTMKFSDTFVGSLIACRCADIGPEQQSLKLYAKDKILTVCQSQLILSDGLGRVSEQLKYDDDRLACMTQLLENFALSIVSADNNQLYSSGRDNLKNMAVIEAAYLSARTGFPEDPGRILQMASRGGKGT